MQVSSSPPLVGWRTLRLPQLSVPPSLLVAGTDAILLSAAGLLLSGVLGLTLALAAFLTLSVPRGIRSRIHPRVGVDLPWLTGRLGIAYLLVAPIYLAVGHTGKMTAAVLVAVPLVVAGRGLSYLLVRKARASGLIREPVLIIGAGPTGARAARTLEEHPEYGLIPLGFVESDEFQDPGSSLPILGSVDDLEDLVSRYHVRRVIVAFGAVREPDVVRILRTCSHLPVEVHVIPRFFELGAGGDGGPFTDDLWGIPLVWLRRSALRTASWRMKRGFDVAVTAALLIVASPVFLVIAAAVRASSPGPVFFRQKRIGQWGEVFECLKFRTMRVNDDSDTNWTVAGDARVTRLGAFLRRTSLDELPQLINVLRGEMSLVGPRPERPYFVDQFRVAVRGYEDRHRVPVGITGWAQVHGLRGDTSIEERALFDNAYVDTWSPWRDLVIVARTAGALLRGKGH